MSKPHTIVVGGGFAGLNAAHILGRAKHPVTLIDQRNFHLFQPLLYQVATGFLAPGDIAGPLRAEAAHLPTVRVIQDSVLDIDPHRRVVSTSNDQISYDALIVATGVTHSYFGNEDWAKNAPGLKTIEDAVQIRSKVLAAFEQAERARDENVRERWMTFAIVGGGPTGVELAGALAELARSTLKGEFRNIDPHSAKIHIFEGGPRLLSSFSPALSQYTFNTLEKLGVTINLNTRVCKVTEDCIQINHQGGVKEIPTHTTIWAAGVKASALGEVISSRCNAETDKMGRIKVNQDLSVGSFNNIFVVGDLAHFATAKGDPLPGVAPVAIQQGRYVANLITAGQKRGGIKPFAYFDKGNMAVIGKGRAVAETGRIRMTGFVAWLAWAFVHIYFLIDFENKVVVFFHWAWNYLTNKRGSRLITKG